MLVLCTEENDDNYGSQICGTEIISFGKSNDEDNLFFNENKKKNTKSKQTKKQSPQKTKIKQVSIDINKKTVINSYYKDILNRFQKKKQNISSDYNVTQENNYTETNGYVRTEYNDYRHNLNSPKPISTKQNSLKSISGKSPITISYQMYSTNVKY